MYKKLVLKNGLRIIAVPLPGNETVTVQVLVEAGSKYEIKKLNGISHFLEHMTFKGTKKRPTPLDIAGVLDRVGAQYNAATGQEYTTYYAKASGKHLDLVFDIIADIFLNPKFDSLEAAKEKGVVIEELNMYKDLPARRVADLWDQLLYGDQPAGWDVGGKKETITKMTSRDLMNYHSDNYVADKTVVVVSGKVKPEFVFKKAEALFKKISVKKGKDKKATSEFQEMPQVLVEYKKTDQTHMMLGVRAYNLSDPRRYAADVLATVLGGGMSSRLFQLLRGKMGVAYYVSTESENATDVGYLVTHAGIDTKRSEEVISSILREYKKLTQKKVPADELSKVKENIIGSLTLKLESSDDWAGFYGFQEISRREINEPKEIIKKINQVTADDIRAVAQDIFKPEKLNLAVIGPFENKSVFGKLLAL